MGASSMHDSPQRRRVRAASERLVHLSEIIVVTAAELLVVVSILVATGILYILFINGLGVSWRSPHSIDTLQAGVEQVFAGVLLLMLGLELLKSLTNFFSGFRVQVEILVGVAIIAVARHIMLIDLKHTDWTTLVGAAALVVALAVSFALVRQRAPPVESDRAAGDG